MRSRMPVIMKTNACIRSACRKPVPSSGNRGNMELLTKLLKSQLSVINKLADGCSVEKSRTTQDMLGKLMASGYRAEVTYHPIDDPDFAAECIKPALVEHPGILLYLHGGGYVSGHMDYAEGFGTVLAARCHVPVCCAAYRLAPEDPYPAALEDVLCIYRYLLGHGYPDGNIVLCGESAGGGLVYALALRLKAEGLPLPRGMIGISPWSDLTASGPSYVENRILDPSMTQKRLRFYAQCYAEQLDDPYVSPLFGELEGLPPSLLFVGGHEIMLSDAVQLHEKLLTAGCRSELHIAPEMWHIYLLYGVKEAKDDYQKITAFVQEVLDGGA